MGIKIICPTKLTVNAACSAIEEAGAGSAELNCYRKGDCKLCKAQFSGDTIANIGKFIDVPQHSAFSAFYRFVFTCRKIFTP